jgi:hypothetical protein
LAVLALGAAGPPGAVIEEFTRFPARAQPAVPTAVGELTPRESGLVSPPP